MSNLEAENKVQDSEMEIDSNNEHTFAKPELSTKEVEKLEEAKLKAKYPRGCSGPPLSGHSAFLQKKLAKGQKFFDSGDYQMAKQTPVGMKARQVPSDKSLASLAFGTGEAIPTPETVPARKTSIIQPKFNHPTSSTT